VIVLRCAFWVDWHFPTLLHQLVSQSLAPELWLSGSSKEGDRRNMQWKAHTILHNIHVCCLYSESWFLLNLNTYLSEPSLWQLQLHLPARLLLLHAVLETLQDALLWRPQEWQLSLEGDAATEAQTSNPHLTVSANTFLYVSQSFCRILWLSSASFSFVTIS